jgi:hypothetical protein
MSDKGKRVVYRNATIGASVLCVFLIIAVAYSVLTYTTMLQGKDSEILYWQNQATSQSSDRNSLQAEIDQLERDKANLQSQLNQKNSEIDNLNKIINLQQSTVWVNDETVSNPAGASTYWTRTANYAGYVVMNVETSTTTNTYVQVTYSSHGVSYDEKITVGASGTAVFPVLPATITVRVGNTNLLNGATETVTVTYYY